jgi:AcrR family transcriptional regulator
VNVAPLATSSRRRPAGQVRRALIEAGMELARLGGPDAVVLREATRRVGVAPNAAYRHFADRDDLLAAVCVGAMAELARRMQAEVKATPRRRKAADTAIARLKAIGIAYLEFAMQETGLFNTAFAVPGHMEYAVNGRGDEAGPTPFQVLSGAIDELVTAGVLPAARRPHAEYPVWASVHGMAVLITQGPLRQLPDELVSELNEQLFQFITRGV